ncbi:MAG: hypothetical protein V3V18_07145, partial [Methylococcales bacterium]
MDAAPIEMKSCPRLVSSPQKIIGTLSCPMVGKQAFQSVHRSDLWLMPEQHVQPEPGSRQRRFSQTSLR